MYYMVFFQDGGIEILNTQDSSRIIVPKQELGEFIDMLLEAQDLLNQNIQRTIDIHRRLSWLKNGAAVFESELVRLGLVTPIQKQSKALGQDGR